MRAVWQPYTVEGIGELFTCDPVLAGILIGDACPPSPANPGAPVRVCVLQNGLRLLFATEELWWYRSDHSDAEMITKPFRGDPL